MKDALLRQNARRRHERRKETRRRGQLVEPVEHDTVANTRLGTASLFTNGSLLRMVMVIGSLLLNPGKVVKSLALPVSTMPTSTRGGLWIASCRTNNDNDITSRASLPMVIENNKDSTWWLTRRLTTLRPRMDKSTYPATTKPSQRGTKKNNNKKKDDDDTEWALTKFLIPNRLRRR
jgi:hypothetical protein